MSEEKQNILFQQNTLSALMEGLYDGTISFSALKKHGDFGLGTADGLDGELVILDGVGYKCQFNGNVEEMTAHTMVPYAAICSFDEQSAKSFTIQSPLSQSEWEHEVVHTLDSENIIYAVKAEATFSTITFRSIEKQSKPYPRLVEASKEQVEFTKENFEGTIVGYYTPEIFGKISAPGFHLHVISKDKQAGGHILNFDLKEAKVWVQAISQLTQNFPVNDKAFLNKQINTQQMDDDISQAEN